MLKKIDSMLVGGAVWIVRQFELFTPMSHDVLAFSARIATWFYTLPLILVIPSLLLYGEWGWLTLVLTIFFVYRRQTAALKVLLEEDHKRAENAESALRERLPFRLLSLANFAIFAFAAHSLTDNPDMRTEFDIFAILAIASCIVFIYELLACVGPIKKHRRPKSQ